MEQIINSIFQKNIKLLEYCDKTITYLRMQNFYQALQYSTKTIDAIMLIYEDVLNNVNYFNDSNTIISRECVNQILSDLLEAQKSRDYILLADLYELQLIPFFLSLQEAIIRKEEYIYNATMYDKNIDKIRNRDNKLAEYLQKEKQPLDILDDGYSVEYTACGLMTLALFSNNKKHYLHSNGHVLRESGVLAREWFSNDVFEYNIYGLGFGYHIKELMELDDSIVINVYESDLKVIQLACAFTDMSSILMDGRVNLIYDPYFDELFNKIQQVGDGVEYVIHYPSIENIKSSKIKDMMEDYFIQYSSVKNQLHKLNNNFRLNIKKNDDYVDILRDNFKQKDLYIIAAGPSLDKNYILLKKIEKNSIILSTGTVLKKLLLAGIIPDYVIITDGNMPVYSQIKDVNTKNIPLIYLSTVYHKITENYQGKRYLVCQEGYKKAEEYATKMGYGLYKTGGSVATTAIDIGIQLGCRRIICIGLDLAYSNNQDHAFDTEAVNVGLDTTGLKQVKDIYGKLVSTSKNLDIYRKWIERRIENVEEIEFINATEGGAFINGMKVSLLKDCINE